MRMPLPPFLVSRGWAGIGYWLAPHGFSVLEASPPSCASSASPGRPFPLPGVHSRSSYLGFMEDIGSSCFPLPPPPLTPAVTLGNHCVYQKAHLSANICSIPQLQVFTSILPPTPSVTSYFVTMQYCFPPYSSSPESSPTASLSSSISLDPKANHSPIHAPSVPSLLLLCPYGIPHPQTDKVSSAGCSSSQGCLHLQLCMSEM